jgi:hypothetical protein
MKISRQPTAAHHLRTLTANMVTGLLLAWAGAAAAANVAEDEADLAAIYGDKEFISLATGSKQPLSRAPAVATVITGARHCHHRSHAISMKCLQAVPGMHVSRWAICQSTRCMPMRGICSNQIQPGNANAVQNGVPITMPLLQ